MRNRGLALALTGALVITASCGGGDDDSPGAVSAATPIGPAGGSVSSSDGMFVLDVPAGALDDTVDITITKTGESEWDDELAEAEPRNVYRMEPSGLEFASPATATITTTIEEDGDGVTAPGYLLFDDEGFSVLGDISTSIDLDSSMVTSTFDVPHFSDLTEVSTIIVLFLERLDPIERNVGERFQTTASIRSLARNVTLLSEKVELVATAPVNAVAGLSVDVNLDPVTHGRIDLGPGDEKALDAPVPEWICTQSSPPRGTYGFDYSARIGGDLYSGLIRRNVRLNPFARGEWRWDLSIRGPVDCVGAFAGTTTTTSLVGPEDGDEEATDPCANGGCVGYGTGFSTGFGTFNWTPTECATTPESTEGDIEIRPGSTGARIDLPGLGGSITVGGGTVTPNGSGAGGTITTNGETIRRSRDIEVLGTDENGAQLRVEQRSGPVDENGDMIQDQSTCDEGGVLDIETDLETWAAWLDLPIFQDPPIVATGPFTCFIEVNPDGSSQFYFWLPLDAAAPDPPSPFDIQFDIFGPGDTVRTGPDSVTPMFPFETEFNGPPARGTPPGALPVDGNGVWGTFGLEHLGGVDPGGLFDVQPIVSNGVIGVFLRSEVCPGPG
jgi:hypothetical protein